MVTAVQKVVRQGRLKPDELNFRDSVPPRLMDF